MGKSFRPQTVLRGSCSLLFRNDFGVLEEQPLIGPRRPFDSILDAIRMDFVVERRVWQYFLAQLEDLTNQRAPLLLVALAALLLCEFIDLRIGPVHPSAAIVETSNDEVCVHNRGSIGKKVHVVELAIGPEREECRILHALQTD